MALRFDDEAELRRILPNARIAGMTSAPPAPTPPTSGTITLWLALPVKGKARPRAFLDGDKIRARKPKAYAAWIRQAVAQFRAQWPHPPLQRVDRLDVVFWGGSRANDGDNGIGSVCDALVKACVIVDDNLTRIPSGSWDWQPADTPRIAVTLKWSTTS